MSISLRALCGAVAITVTISVWGAAPAVGEPTQDLQCRDRTWAKLHPQICYKYTGGPFGIGGGTGGGGPDDRGIIGRVLGGLTGGLL